MSFEKNTYTVYVKVNEAGFITAVNSSAFLTDLTGWVEIDSGSGSRFGHAQTAYFSEPIITDRDAYRYKLVDGAVMKCTQQEISAQVGTDTVDEKSLEERVSLLEHNATEISKLITGILSGAAQK